MTASNSTASSSAVVIGASGGIGAEGQHRTSVPCDDEVGDVLRALAQKLDGKVALIGVGGITEGRHAKDKIDAGAQLVQLYSGLIYRGPALVADAARALAES